MTTALESKKIFILTNT